MDLNRKFKYNEEVLIFDDELENGLPRVLKGRVTGILQGKGIYSFRYQVESPNGLHYRFPDAVYKSVEEITADIVNLIAE